MRRANLDQRKGRAQSRLVRDIVHQQHVDELVDVCHDPPRLILIRITTIVIRETSAFSVRPTVKESMLNATAPEQRNDPRKHALACFPRKPQMYASMSFSIRRGRFHNRTRPPDHFMQPRARGHHRVDRIFLLDLKINQHRALVRVRGPYRGNHFAPLASHAMLLMP